MSYQRFDNQLDELYRRDGFPGATAACVGTDGSVHDYAVGYADVEHKTPMRTDTVMLSASTGKMYVGALVLKLVQEGRVSLEDKVQTWLGNEAWFSRVPNAGDMTLCSLLNHSSGIPDHVYMPDFKKVIPSLLSDPNKILSPQQLVSFVLDAEPLCPVGAAFNYSDTGFVMAGMVIERVTGTSYYQHLHDTFLGPMQLADTFPIVHRDLPRLAQGYIDPGNPFGLPETTTTDGCMNHHPGNEYAGGGLASTAADLVRWSHKVFQPGGLVKNFAQKITEYGMPITTPFEGIYGLGTLVMETTLGRKFCHGGWIPGYRTDLAYYLEQGLGVAVMVNTDHDSVTSNEAIVAYGASLAAGLVNGRSEQVST